ncbi:YgjV family protein [Nocardioides ferulae]|uniref:YgjV family protein n=1 Tax=Nocardioides ferulae TaxID=2340821 RepID=UPI000EB2EAD7|nr:YgjV family protein [Nocardioides ferulae]
MDFLADHWLDILGWAGSALLVFSLLQARVLRFRTLNLVASFTLVVFNALIEVWSMAAMNAVLVAINAWFIAQLVRQRHDEQTFDVLEVGPRDEFLRHTLRVHGADILRFQPDFLFDPEEPGVHAFLVMRGDETVGVVVLREDGDIAQVELDYVTPRFRDFSPGEFVWRRSRVLRDLGFRRVVTPPNMVGAYYEKVGFRSHGDRFVLDL